jgi:hypothetical protein
MTRFDGDSIATMWCQGGRDVEIAQRLGRNLAERTDRDRPITDQDVMRWATWAAMGIAVALFWVGAGFVGVIVWHHWRGSIQAGFILGAGALFLATCRVQVRLDDRKNRGDR